ncbi:MAG: divergent polysaccharide deacetylase family protein [Candidatus Eisenbacteria bacterium]|nr:divergent polysaccharide deacetylase family protein [Candidatus Eisenbacteria bacterium]
MARSRRRTSAWPRGLLALAAVAFVILAGAEAYRLASTGAGRIALARLGLGDPAKVTRDIGQHIRAGLVAAGVPRDSLRESVTEAGPAALRWRVGLKPDASLIQANYAVTRRVEEAGARVLSGRESTGPHGESIVTLLIGLPKRPTHEIVLTRGARRGDDAVKPAARLALVLFGFGEDAARARAFMALHAPFAVAIVPGAKSSAELFRAAHAAGREVVLHLPLEPVNYPQVNPGPGTLLVTMPPTRISGIVKRWLDQAGPVIAAANHMGSLATQDMTVMSAVYRELKRRHVPFVHVRPAAGAVCRSLAADMGVVYEEPGAVLDAEARGKDAKALERRWGEILRQARARGRLEVWVRATPLTREWLPRATTPKKLEGVDLAPLSGVMRRPAEL